MARYIISTDFNGQANKPEFTSSEFDGAPVT